MANEPKKIIMIAVENGALINGKVGGLADVIRDLPLALGDAGYQVTVIVPSYGFLQTVNPSSPAGIVTFPFAGIDQTGQIFEVQSKKPHKNVRQLLLEHPLLRGNPIYSTDPPDQPFASDATKYALFCSAAGQMAISQDDDAVIHLHDWHTGFFFLLRGLHPAFAELKKRRVVFTIHNLSYQGTRPIHGKIASVEIWFPELFRDEAWIAGWKDQRYASPSFTPMYSAIVNADMMNTVSPTYAKEILIPSNPQKGFYGGEGLEKLLRQSDDDGRLTGILNGIEYPANRTNVRITFDRLLEIIESEVRLYNKTNSPALPESVMARILSMKLHPAGPVITSVTRVSDQKIRLLFEKGTNGKTALDMILEHLKENKGFYIFLGNGEPKYEKLLEQRAASNERFLYLKLYSDIIAQSLFANGTIFLMPSSFEPCGLTQMIAMRNGQPCIVHATGGLKDTVTDGVNGFQFEGNDTRAQVDHLVRTVRNWLDIYNSDKTRWERIRNEAARSRFEWKDSAKKYAELLYKY
jgi:starch synthase